MVKALWRELEEMTPEQRADRLLPKDVQVWDKVEGQPMPICPHTDDYIKVRGSFTHSPEWRRFRQKFLEAHPVCERCGRKADSVHHRESYRVEVTLIAWGFRWVFARPECCEALCTECHYAGHGSPGKDRGRLANRRRSSWQRWIERWHKLCRRIRG